MGPAFNVIKGVWQWWAVRGCLIGRVQFHVVGKNAKCSWIDLLRVKAINDIINKYNENKGSKNRALNHTAANGYLTRKNIVDNNSLRTTR